ncbi:hypothetical protein BKA63DRAFT_209813 [Paraphoma chrysanthemicola]|nr:hypothetical protein BKA63DRAFT_209813 [Paraphoma chrysanthemicola]
MPGTRILLTGADGLIGSHILAQLLSYETVSVRAVVRTRGAVAALRQQYSHALPTSLDICLVPRQDFSLPGDSDSVFGNSIEPFGIVVHTLTANSSNEADCLAKFINLETDRALSLLSLIQVAAPTVTRVVIVTSLAPFARWLIGPGTSNNPTQVHFGATTIDTGYILAASQASDNIVYDALAQWPRKSGARFDVTYFTAPNVYGPTVLPLETSTDLSEGNRRIWDICSNDSSTRTDTSPYGIDPFLDVRDLATSVVRAVFIHEAANQRFVLAAGIMPSGAEIAKHIVNHFPQLRGRIRTSGAEPRRYQATETSLESFNTYLVSSILGIDQLRTAEVTIRDTTQQMLDLQQRKTWKSVIES